MRFIFYFIFLRWFIRILFSAQTDPIETLYVSVEGDVTGLLDDIDKGVDKSKDKLEELDDAGSNMGKGLKSSAGAAGLAFGLAAGGAAKLLDVVVNLAAATAQAFVNLGKEAVQANAEFETFATQFETLLGSSDAAQDRLEELAQFGVETPFELPEIVEASRQLQVFGGTALATGDNLTMIGDIAAGVNQPFQDVAFWIGRMYDAMQNGQPFGEASARLQEMGALSGDTRRKLEEMQKTGAEGAEIFAVFSEEVGGRFTGNMEKLSKTFQGVTSNLEDFRGNLLRVGGAPIFDEVRQSAIEFLDFLNANEGTITAIATGIGELAASVIRFGRDAIGQIDFAGFLTQGQKFIEWLKETVNAALAFGSQISSLNDGVGQFFGFLASVRDSILAPFVAIWDSIIEKLGLSGIGFGSLSDALVTAAQTFAIISAEVKFFTALLSPIAELLGSIGRSIAAFITLDFDTAIEEANKASQTFKEGLFDVDAGVKAFEDSMRQSAKDIDNWVNPAKEAEETVKSLGKTAQETGEIVEDALVIDPTKIDQFSDQLIDATEQRNEQLEQLEIDHAKKVAQIQEDGNEKRAQIDEKFSDALAKLAKDSEDKRLDVIADTREKLADLAEETDRDLATKRKEFDKDELRETEDHLKEMRRLEEDHLMSLSDAVKNRDAGAIVDLQRKFELESSRREEDFNEGRSQQREDFDTDLEAVRENEAQKRAEILEAQAQTLEDIRQNEEEKQLELETRRAEELQKLEEDQREKLDKENQSYMERQAALDEALQKRLESIAQSLANEKDVTEEGAREILETFNEYFGIGGNIDKLMDDFASRRKQKAEIQAKFSGEDQDTSTSSSGEGRNFGTFGGLGQRLGGVQEFASGGTLVATSPTLAMFGEAGPEVVQFTPMSQLSSPGNQEPGRMVIEMTGSAPPGIGASERDQIASVLVTALQETGALG